MVQVLKGNIVQAPALGELQITEQGYLVMEDGVISVATGTDQEEAVRLLQELCLKSASDPVPGRSDPLPLPASCKSQGLSPFP